MKPEQGLFQFDFDDYHAVLGVPITADTKAVRKRYLTIARKLHPDSLSEAPAEEARQASDILSKLVNPAYEALSQEKSSTEHLLVLKLKGQSLRQNGSPPAVRSAAAQALVKASYAESAYRQAINGLAVHQFDQLDAVTHIMGELSELNLVYLYCTSLKDDTAARPRTAPVTPQSTLASASSSPGQAAVPSPRQAQSAILESYINRAQEYEYNKDYSRAILELREAVKAYPTNGQCHSYLSILYLKAGQATMARIHAKRALDINPKDEKALAVQARVEKAGTGSTSGAAKATGPKSPNPKSSDQGGGFFGLFGGKKKS